MGLPPTPTPTGSDAPWLRYQGGAPAPSPASRGAPVYIAPAPKSGNDLELERLRTEQARLNRDQAQLNLEQDRNPPPKYRPLAEQSRKTLEGNVSTYSTLRDAAGSFNDDYAGNTITGRSENWIQNLNSGFGTPGQAQWWARFDALDSQIRNDLYGSALTPTEKAAFDRTTINPSMDPKQIRENLSARTEIVRKALGRQVNTYRAGKIDPEVLDAAVGDIAPDLAPDFKAAGDAQAPVGNGAMDASTGLSLGGPGRQLAPDEEVSFGDAPEASTVRGRRYTPEAEARLARAAMSGASAEDLIALSKQLTNGEITISPDSARALSEYYRDPKNRSKSPAFDYGAGDAGATSQYEREQYGEYLQPELERQKARQDYGQGSIESGVVGFADNVPYFDEAAAGLGALFRGGGYADNLQRVRARIEAQSRVNPKSRLTGQVAGAVATAAIPAARFLGGGRVGNLAREGALYGAVYGSGSADPDPNGSFSDSLQSRIGGGLTGGLIGGTVGAGLGGLAGRIANRRQPPPPNGPSGLDIARAAAEEGVPISRPIVDANTRNRMMRLEGSPGGSNTVRNSLDATEAGIEDASDALGRGGTVLDEFGMGTVVQNAARRDMARTRTRASRFYDRAAQMAGDNPVSGREAVRVLDENIADLSQNANANAPLIRYLEEIRGDFVDDAGNFVPKTVGAIRDLRTSLRGQINNRNLTATDAERRIGMVLDAARGDIQRDLGAAAPAAVNAYARADRFYRERQSDINNVLQRVLGRSRDQAAQISPERAWANIRSMAGPRGDSNTLERLWSRLEPSEQLDAAATLAETFGRRGSDLPFTAANFIRATDQLSTPARRAMFGPEGARSIANLRLVANELQTTRRSLNNSRSGVLQNFSNEIRNIVTRGGIGGLLGSALAGPTGGFVGAGLGAVAGRASNYLSARALMSPDLSRWMLRAARANTPSRAQGAIEALSTVARRDPAIAQDALGLQQMLREAMSQTPMRAAAEDGDSGPVLRVDQPSGQ